MATVSVYVAAGVGGTRAVVRLRADHRLRVTSSPRHAELLVLAGALPADAVGALRAVHDQLLPPRGVAAVGVSGDLSSLGLGSIVVAGDRHAADGAAGGGGAGGSAASESDPYLALRALRDDVQAGGRGSPAHGPADNPVDWQGVGPHGQGGEGMMGGTPYGRPMAMPPVEGRDGLALDRLSLRLGPFLPGLPAGLTLVAGLQGDVLAEVELEAAGTDDDALIGTPHPDLRPAREREAGRRLEALAELCALAGLGAEARRVARVAIAPTAHGVAHLRRRLDRPWSLRAATDGVGPLGWDGRDATDRWRRWLDEAATALDDGVPGIPTATRIDGAGRADLAQGLVGLDVGQALLTLASLRVELEAGAADRVVRHEP